MNLGDLKKLLKERGIRPSPRMGQSFLIDAGALRQLARSLRQAGKQPGIVIEIGCGPGNLTEALLDEGMKVLAIERDRRLGRLCRQRLVRREGLWLILADALQAPLRAVPAVENAALAGNLPYSLTGELLRIVTQELPFIRTAGIVLQEEVSARILARPGEKDYGALTLIMGMHWNAVKGIEIGPESFYPRPAVTSRQILLARKERTGVDPGLAPLLMKIIVESFKYRRKKLKNVLALVLPALGRSGADAAAVGLRAGIDLDARPEALSQDDFIRLAGAIAKDGTE
jgi:16S rRNA (adenine1518-N6/adenine1519-N6)-dimethyltransferase